MADRLHVVGPHSLVTNTVGPATVHVYHFSTGTSHAANGRLDHSYVVALTVGAPTGLYVPPLVRMHSRCLYGEVFGSQDCDCLSQLTMTWERIKEESRGVLIYLEQEGRGCGLIGKASGYRIMQEKGKDTVDAYRELGYPIDARQYGRAAAVLKNMGLQRVRLLTNNPAKITGLVSEGIEVDPISLRVPPTPLNKDYLLTKQHKLGHDLGL